MLFKQHVDKMYHLERYFDILLTTLFSIILSSKVFTVFEKKFMNKVRIPDLNDIHVDYSINLPGFNRLIKAKIWCAGFRSLFINN